VGRYGLTTAAGAGQPGAARPATLGGDDGFLRDPVGTINRIALTSHVIGLVQVGAYSVLVRWFNAVHTQGVLMSTYQVHTIDSAPEQSKPVLRQLNETFGFIPNIAGAMSESPVLIGAFIGVFQKVHSGTFDEAQIQTLLLTNAVTNSSAWAVAFHTFLALKQGVTAADVQAIRRRALPADKKLAALSSLAKTLIESRGHVSDRELESFVQAGFTKAQALEVITVVAASTITNYVGSVTKPPLEAQFQEHVWNG
jgi:hypothetical protein